VRRLPSGLEIVRKTLGGHEIATVQSTAIDKEAGSFASPRCSPIHRGSGFRRNGRSAGSARRRRRGGWERRLRYALFTLVGIAGEDDLDAPDLGEGGKADAADKGQRR
jgi:hypothetical protein